MRSSTAIETGEPPEVVRRGRRSAGQDPAKRQQILDGARRVFMDMGFDAASMNDITRAAGVSKGTIYVYFANKEELFVALIDEERVKIFSDMYDALAQEGELRDLLVRYGVALTSKITSRTVLMAQRTVMAICERIPHLGKQFYERGPKRGHLVLSEFLRKAVDRGELSIPDIELASYQFTDLCSAGIYRQCMFGYREEPPAIEEIRRTVTAGVSMFLKAYAPEKIHVVVTDKCCLAGSPNLKLSKPE